MENQKRGHVIVLAYPAQGHLNPLLQFAKHLASKGLKATLATTPYTISCIHAPTVSIEPISDGYDKGGFKQASSVEAYLESFKSVGSRTLAELILKTQDSSSISPPVNCIIYDSLLPWALDVAKEFGIYSAVFLTNSASVCTLFWLIRQGQLSLPLKQESFPISIPGLISSLGISDVPSFIARPEEHSAYLAAILDKFNKLEQNDWVFCNTFQDLEIEVVETLEGQWPLATIGPMIPSAFLDHPNEGETDTDTAYGASLWKQTSKKHYLEWLDTKQPNSVVYVSFGSMASIAAKQAEEVAQGLKASEKHFLWVVKEYEKNFPREFLDGMGKKGLVVTWCNQVEVLAHPAVGCFITHCGWNSVLEGLSIGKPMIGMPQWSDQPTNAKFLEEIWGVGLRAKRDEGGIVTGKELELCIREVMDGERKEYIRKNASKWRESAARAASPGGTSDQTISGFVKMLMT